MKYRFGDFEVDLHSATLRNADRVIPTQRLTFDTLVFLIQNRGRVVTRDELLRGPWRGTFVSDGAINQTISLARKALSAGADSGVRIETVRGRGFQFVGDVDCDAPDRAVGMPIARPRDESWIARPGALRALTEAYEGVVAGSGAFVVVAGEPGIGKTTLVREFVTGLETRGAWVAWGNCVERRGSSPFEPWLEIVSKLLDRPSISARDEVLRARVGIEPLFPELAARLGYATSATLARNPGMRRVAFDAVARFVRALSREQPVVLVFEDLHAVDEDSYDLLRSVVPALRETRAMVLCSLRDTEGPTSPIVRDVLADDRTLPSRIVRIEGLDADGSRALLQRLLPIDVTPSLLERVIDLTGGNPLLVQELARNYRASGSIDSLTGVLESFRVPDRVGETVRRNLASLPQDSQRSLRAAAVVGREFELAVVAAMLSEPAAKTAAALQEVFDAGWLLEESRLRAAFRHALVRESILATVSPIDRAVLNQSAAEALGAAGTGTNASLLARIAFHYSLAAPFGDPTLAVDHECLAARAAIGRLAYRDAVAHFERALDALSLGKDDVPRRMAIMLDLARAARDAGNRPRALEMCERVTSLARSAADWRVFARAVVMYGDTQTELVDPTLLGLCEEALAGLPDDALELRALVLTRLAVISNFMMMWERRDAAVRESLALADQLDDDNVRAHALQAQRWCMDARHTPSEALAVSTEAVAIADRVGEMTLANEMRRWKFSDHLRMGQREAALGAMAAHRDVGTRLQEPWHHAWDLRMAATVAMIEARLDDADRLATETLVASQEAGDSISVFLYWCFATLVRREQGRMDEAEPFARQAIEALPWNPAWKCALAVILADSGRLDAAREQLAVVIADDCAAIPPDMNALTARTMLAEAAVMVGDRGAAEVLYRQLAPLGRRANVIAAGIAADTPVDIVLAQLALQLGRYDDAARHLDDADRLCDGLRATLWIARARHVRARLAWVVGKHREAAEIESAVLADADRLGLAGITQSSARFDPELHAAAKAERGGPSHC